MKNKINIAELLKDCPKGMELDCTSYNNVSFDKISEDKKATYPIFCYITDEEGNRSGISFTENGCESKRYGAKCVIFPKGKTTWEGFVPPCKFKDGDVIIVIVNRNLWYGIYQKELNTILYCYVSYSDSTQKLYSSNKNGMCQIDDIVEMRLATEGEKQKLFDAINYNGYKWNAETKTLEKLIKPKFKVGDRVKHKTHIRQVDVVTEIKDTHYILDDELALPFISQDQYELVPNKFDFTTLKPFDKVLVRDSDKDMWCASIFSHTWKDKYFCIGTWHNQCIPYEAHKELLGTNNNPE